MAGPKRPPPPRRVLRATRHKAVKEGLRLRLRELRDELTLTREQLALASGVNYNQLTKLEDATSGGSIQTWTDLADGLGVPLSAMFEPPTKALATGAAEPGLPTVRSRGAELATPTQLSQLADAAASLDRDAVAALLALARRLGRSSGS